MSEVPDTQLVNETHMGAYISPNEFAARVAECIEKFGPIDFWGLKEKVIEATPKITAHPSLEVTDHLLSETVAHIIELDIGVVLDENGILSA